MNEGVTFRRLLTLGDLPDSGGGLYNPSVWVNANGQEQMLVRRELDYTWRRPSFPTVVDPVTKAHCTLTPVGLQEGFRIEDCRVFMWRGVPLVSHVEYLCAKGRVASLVRQRISVIDGDQILKWDDWKLPIPLHNIEKNWGLASDGQTLYCVYSLDPLQVFRRKEDGTWVLHALQETGLTAKLGNWPKNSTHLIPFDGGWLGFWHFFKPRSTYVTGAFWLDADFQMRKHSDVLIDGSWVQGEDVFKPGVYYVSSAIIRGNRLYLYAGEGDSHTSEASLHIEDLRFGLR